MFSGTAHGYHILSIGLYVDQIIRRVDPQKRSLQQYFREEIAEPFGEDENHDITPFNICIYV